MAGEGKLVRGGEKVIVAEILFGFTVFYLIMGGTEVVVPFYRFRNDNIRMMVAQNL